MDIISIAVICLITAIMVKLLQPASYEIGLAVSIAAVFMILGSLASDIADVISHLSDLVSRAEISNSYISVAVKVLGISYICELCSSSCRDAGETALGSIVDIAGKVAISTICLPVISALIETISKILESQ